jgi:hypothetical protein
VDHYSLAAILAVGYRVRSTQGTRFRQWATARLDEYLVKGFVLDDAWLASGAHLGEDYFDELIERIRAIRASERRFYQKITDIYAPDAATTRGGGDDQGTRWRAQAARLTRSGDHRTRGSTLAAWFAGSAC